MRPFLLLTLLGCVFAVRQTAEAVSNLSNSDLQQLGTSFAKVLLHARADSAAVHSAESNTNIDRKLLSSDQSLPGLQDSSSDDYKSWYTGSYVKTAPAGSSSRLKANIMGDVETRPSSKGFSYLEEMMGVNEHEVPEYRQGGAQYSGGDKSEDGEAHKRRVWHDEDHEEQNEKYRWGLPAALLRSPCCTLMCEAERTAAVMAH
jgi:hypothetical protein